MSSTDARKTLLVLGGTGNQGGAVLRYLAKHEASSFHLRSITRNASSPASQALKDLGVEMLQADASSAEALKLAFAGVTHIFANTDSNQVIQAAARDPSLLQPGETPLSHAREVELQQGRNIIEAAVATPTLERIIWSSIASPRKWTNGRLSKAVMFDTKEDIADMMWARPELKSKLSILLVGFYVANAIHVPHTYCPQKQADGVYELALPLSSDSPQAHADVDSDIGSWTMALFKAAPGTTLLGSSEKATFKQWTETWAATNNVQGRFRQASREEFEAKAGAMGEAIAQAVEFVEEKGLEGGIPNVLYPEDLRKQGIAIQTTPLADAMRRIDWSSVM